MVILAFLSLNTSLNAQKVAFNFGLGIGNSYMFENRQDEDYNYSSSGMTRMGLKFTGEDSYFGLKAEFIYVSTNYNFNYGYVDLGFDGYHNYGGGNVSSYSTFLILDHINQKSDWRLGYSIGMGYTKEVVSPAYGINMEEDTRKFTSMMFAPFLSIQAGKRSAFRLTPTLMWTDPINTFRKDEWVRAGEDLHLLWSFGFAHTIN